MGYLVIFYRVQQVHSKKDVKGANRWLQMQNMCFMMSPLMYKDLAQGRAIFFKVSH